MEQRAFRSHDVIRCGAGACAPPECRLTAPIRSLNVSGTNVAEGWFADIRPGSEARLNAVAAEPLGVAAHSPFSPHPRPLGAIASLPPEDVRGTFQDCANDGRLYG